MLRLERAVLPHAGPGTTLETYQAVLMASPARSEQWARGGRLLSVYFRADQSGSSAKAETNQMPVRAERHRHAKLTHLSYDHDYQMPGQ